MQSLRQFSLNLYDNRVQTSDLQTPIKLNNKKLVFLYRSGRLIPIRNDIGLGFRYSPKFCVIFYRLSKSSFFIQLANWFTKSINIPITYQIYQSYRNLKIIPPTTPQFLYPIGHPAITNVSNPLDLSSTQQGIHPKCEKEAGCVKYRPLIGARTTNSKSCKLKVVANKELLLSLSRTISATARGKRCYYFYLFLLIQYTSQVKNLGL